MCACGFGVRREGRRGAVEVGGEGWKERSLWGERTTFFRELQVVEGKALSSHLPLNVQPPLQPVVWINRCQQSWPAVITPEQRGWGLNTL